MLAAAENFCKFFREICRVVDIEEKWMDKKHSVGT